MFLVITNKTTLTTIVTQRIFCFFFFPEQCSNINIVASLVLHVGPLVVASHKSLLTHHKEIKLFSCCSFGICSICQILQVEI